MPIAPRLLSFGQISLALTHPLVQLFRVSTVLKRVAALANPSRVQIVGWLKDPERHFLSQQEADMAEVGVCGMVIAAKLGMSSATTSEHMRRLTSTGLVRAKRIGNYIYFRRDDEALAALAGDIRAL